MYKSKYSSKMEWRDGENQGTQQRCPCLVGDNGPKHLGKGILQWVPKMWYSIEQHMWRKLSNLFLLQFSQINLPLSRFVHTQLNARVNHYNKLMCQVFQEVNQQGSETQPLISTLENPMVSQLHDEATPSSQLLPLFFLCNTTNWIPFVCRLPKLCGKLQWHNQLQILPTSPLTFHQQDTCDLQQHPILWGLAGYLQTRRRSLPSPRRLPIQKRSEDSLQS